MNVIEPYGARIAKPGRAGLAAAAACRGLFRGVGLTLLFGPPALPMLSPSAHLSRTGPVPLPSLCRNPAV
jgi:hypothetical protein